MDPNEVSEAERIRLKRIARLQALGGGGATSSSSTPTQPSQATSDGDSKPSNATTSVSASAPSVRQPASTPAPSSSSTAKDVRKPAPAPVKPPVASSSQQKFAQAPPKPSTSSARFSDSFEDWQNAAIGRILRVAIELSDAEATQWQHTYLKSQAEEILADNPGVERPLKLKADYIDSLLIARLNIDPSDAPDDPEMITALAALPASETVFEYLAGCWKRERSERYRITSRKTADEAEANRRLEVLNHIRDLLVSYIGLDLMEPSTFPQEHIQGKKVGPLELMPLLVPSTSNPGVLSEVDVLPLLSDLANRYVPSEANDWEGGLENVLAPLIGAIGLTLLFNKLDIGGGGNTSAGNWRDLLQALRTLTSVKGIASVIPTIPSFDPLAHGQMPPEVLEHRSLLGPFLRLSTFPDAFGTISQQYFPNPSEMTREAVASASASLRGTLQNVQGTLHAVLHAIVLASPSSREAVLAYYGHVAAANTKRAAMRVDPKTVSTEGFIINLHTTLLAFAGPFTDPQFSKIDKIDSDYFRVSKRIDISEDTKMSATKQESDEYYGNRPTDAPAPNFISEIFFLCCLYQHIGINHAIRAHKSLEQTLSHWRRELRDLEADTTWQGTPQEAGARRAIEQLKKRVELLSSDYNAYEIQLLDPAYLQKCVTFANLVMAWLVRLVDPKKQHPHTPIQLPLPQETPLQFKMLPEYLIEDITEILTFVSRYSPMTLAESSQDELLNFMLVFLSTPYMKNPYLKGQFVEIMFYLTRPMPGNNRGSLGDAMDFMPIALKNLMPCLIHAYIEIEVTGSHTQFYDKFNIRYYITQLFKLVWHNPTHRQALQLESRNLDRYVRFANLLMNDTTYLLDDAISNLQKIADVQRQMDDREAWEARPANERQEKEKQLRQWEGSARSDLELGHESLRLLKLFASETKEPFLTPEIVDRLAAMVDMNLSMLAGPRCQDLKVREPEKYKFRPKELLSDVIGIYQELGPRVEFQRAVAKDGRSYSRDLFERAERIARRTAIKTDDEMRVVRAMVEAVEGIKQAEEEDDAALGEVPDEFLDPLTYDIMRDPVVLPSSKTVIDRSTIKQHYLSDPTDPFNRAPLKWEDLKDATELKAQIEAFLSERRGQGKKVDEDKMQVDQA